MWKNLFIFIPLLPVPVLAETYVWRDDEGKHVSTAPPECFQDNGRGGKYVDLNCAPEVEYATTAPSRAKNEGEPGANKNKGRVTTLERQLEKAQEALNKKISDSNRYKSLNRDVSTRGVDDINELNRRKIREMSGKVGELKRKLSAARAAQDGS